MESPLVLELSLQLTEIRGGNKKQVTKMENPKYCRHIKEKTNLFLKVELTPKINGERFLSISVK